MEIIRNAINKLQSSSWTKLDWRLESAGNSAKFEITDIKLHVPIVTLPTKNSVNLTKQLSVYWDSYQTKPAIVIE